MRTGLLATLVTAGAMCAGLSACASASEVQKAGANDPSVSVSSLASASSQVAVSQESSDASQPDFAALEKLNGLVTSLPRQGVEPKIGQTEAQSLVLNSDAGRAELAMGVPIAHLRWVLSNDFDGKTADEGQLAWELVYPDSTYVAAQTGYPKKSTSPVIPKCTFFVVLSAVTGEQLVDQQNCG